MEIKISKEDVEAYVREALIKSSIGDAIHAAILKSFSGYNNPVDAGVKHVINDVVESLLRKDYKDKIEAAVRAEIEKRIAQEVIEKYADAAIEKIIKAAY